MNSSAAQKKLIGSLLLVSGMVGLIAMFFLFKPLRVLFPQFHEITCVTDRICVEDSRRSNEAHNLYAHAQGLVQRKLASLEKLPKVVFCSTRACSQWFGLDGEAAFSVGTFGIIISHRGWKDYYVAHEFIHHWQAGRVGNIKMLLLPAWLTEGMAYSISDDPRRPLPGAIEGYRRNFENWCKLYCQSDLAAAFIKAKGI